MVTRLCPKARVAVGHGKMPAEQLERLIMDFIYGEFDVLVSTTIVENGIDIPNANTIIVNNAQHFGLSDLHQLRGRVGRSNQKAYCYLLSPPEELLSPDARRRLRAIEEFSDLGSGFNIAMQDLDIRGAGNLLGAEQSGFIADIGFETYQKIMQEAVAELRAEGLELPGLDAAERQAVEQPAFHRRRPYRDRGGGFAAGRLRGAPRPAPDSTELDSTKDEAALEAFESRLADRFGPLPRAAKELLNVVRLRWEAIRLGMERVKVKNGLMIVHFVGEENSPYYKSDTFMQLLQRVTQRPHDRFVLKQHNNRLAMAAMSKTSRTPTKRSGSYESRRRYRQYAPQTRRFRRRPARGAAVRRRVMRKETFAGLLGGARAARAVVASTRGEAPAIVEAVRRHTDYLLEFTPATPVPIGNAYLTPATLGRDRLAAAVGAATLYPGRNALIVDFRTAVTLDFVSLRRWCSTAFHLARYGDAVPRAARIHGRAAAVRRHRFPGAARADHRRGRAPRGDEFAGLRNRGLYRPRMQGEVKFVRNFYRRGHEFLCERIKNTIFANCNLVFGLNRILEYNASEEHLD